MGSVPPCRLQYPLYMLLFHLRQGGELILADFFDLLIPHIKDTFPLDRVKDELIEAAQSLKVFMNEYYQEIDKI